MENVLLEGFENFKENELSLDEMRGIRGGQWTSNPHSTYVGVNGDCTSSCDIASNGTVKQCNPPQTSTSWSGDCNGNTPKKPYY
ncbi:hypothetical protein [Dyadobacter sp. 50-39]|uniref:hypothetical protein n=1 Tax=Dyadobacter sp. 50-39 TaxID=1895756 RepID=UPI000A6DA97B|nr:hypothetical protein [Dyadobacter sp. 50-39]